MFSSLWSWKLCIISHIWGPALSKLLKFTQLVNERSELNSGLSLFFTWMTHTPWCALECPHHNNSSLLLINSSQCFNQQNFISHSFGDWEVQVNIKCLERKLGFLVRRQLPSLCDLTWPSYIEIIPLISFLTRALIPLTCPHTYNLIISLPNTITLGIRNSTYKFWSGHEYSVQSILLLFLNPVIHVSLYNL